MKKYLKMTGLLAIYYLLSMIIIYMIVYILRLTGVYETVGKLAPAGFYGIADAHHDFVSFSNDMDYQKTKIIPIPQFEQNDRV